MEKTALFQCGVNQTSMVFLYPGRLLYRVLLVNNQYFINGAPLPSFANLISAVITGTPSSR